MKAVINRCFGGFGLSEKAAKWLGLKWDNFGFFHYIEYDNGHHHRDDPRLIACVEALKEEANGDFADLEIVEFPDGISWYIDEYDGIECVRERGHMWPPEEDHL